MEVLHFVKKKGADVSNMSVVYIIWASRKLGLYILRSWARNKLNTKKLMQIYAALIFVR